MEGLKRQLVIGFGVIGGSAAVALVALYFLAGSMTAQADKTTADQSSIAEETAMVSVLARLKSSAPEAAAYSAALTKLLPTHDNLIGFSPWLSAIAKTHNVSVSVAFQGGAAAATDAAPGSDGFSMTANGAAADLTAFLTDIETEAPGFLLSIDSFDLSNDGASYRLSAQGRVFSQ